MVKEPLMDRMFKTNTAGSGYTSGQSSYAFGLAAIRPAHSSYAHAGAWRTPKNGARDRNQQTAEESLECLRSALNKVKINHPKRWSCADSYVWIHVYPSLQLWLWCPCPCNSVFFFWSHSHWYDYVISKRSLISIQSPMDRLSQSPWHHGLVTINFDSFLELLKSEWILK